MKYSYHRAQGLSDISAQLVKYDGNARIIAGGTDLLVQFYEKDKKWQDIRCLIDISPLERELKFIREEEKAIRIGALATHTDIEESPVVLKHLPFLSSASKTVGSPQIRNRGTIGGSICNASPAADPLTPMIAAGTEVVIQGEKGYRKVSLKDFYLGKGDVDLNSGEFVKEFIVKKLPAGMKSEFVKLGRRKALAISRLNVSAALLLNQKGRITAARISPGCIFTVPDRVEEAERALLGQEPSKELFAKAGSIVGEVMVARTGVRWSTEYKLPAVKGIVEEALLKAIGLEV